MLLPLLVSFFCQLDSLLKCMKVPTLVWDGVELAQSTAIARFEVVKVQGEYSISIKKV